MEHIQTAIASLPTATLDSSSRALLTSDRYLHSDKFEVSFGGGSMLKFKVVGTASSGRMLKRTANAFVVPLIDLAVMIPPPSHHNKDSFLLSKDYLNYRYMDVRYTFVCLGCSTTYPF